MPGPLANKAFLRLNHVKQQDEPQQQQEAAPQSSFAQIYLPSMSHRGQLHCLNHHTLSNHNHHTTLSFHSHTLGHTVHSPISKMPPARQNSHASDIDTIRRRVSKACDRCRIKKSKCDGQSPCSRCNQDNAICEFGERLRITEKVYPRGYPEMLERQQTRLIAAIQQLIESAQNGDPFTGPRLTKDDNGKFKTHQVLDHLNLLQPNEVFEEDPQKMQDQLIAGGASLDNRRASRSESENSGGVPDLVRTPSDFRASPFESKPNMNEYNFNAPPSSRPASHSPPMDQFSHIPISHPELSHGHDPVLHQEAWAFTESSHVTPMLRSTNSYAVEPPQGNSFHSEMEGMESYEQWSLHGVQHQSEGVDSFQTHYTQFENPVLYSNQHHVALPEVEYGQYDRA